MKKNLKYGRVKEKGLDPNTNQMRGLNMNAVFPLKDTIINVADYVPNDGSRCVADDIQALIEGNPHRTLYFPDGIYVISHPIMTPADPDFSVCLDLSAYAIIKASDDWSSDEAMIRLGAIKPANDITRNGSNYYFAGGIVDGNGVANGISIDGGRETSVHDVSIKHTKIGVHIKPGCNGNSSDADIFQVNIIGNRSHDSIGVLVEGSDNSFTNMRIADVFIGVKILTGSGSIMRNVHPLYTCDYTDYENSCGFYDTIGDNWYETCYSDHFGIGFYMTKNVGYNRYDSCVSYWYSPREISHIGFASEGKFNGLVMNAKVGFRGEEAKNLVLREGEPGGKGVFQNLIIKGEIAEDDAFWNYFQGNILR